MFLLALRGHRTITNICNSDSQHFVRSCFSNNTPSCGFELDRNTMSLHVGLQAVSRRLVQLAGEVAAAQQRSKAASGSGAPRAAAKAGKGGGIGSVEHTLKVGAVEAAATPVRFDVCQLVL
jgi:hypothetical protein